MDATVYAEALIEYTRSRDDVVLRFWEPRENIIWWAEPVKHEEHWDEERYELVPGHDNGPGDERDREEIQQAVQVYDRVAALKREQMPDRVSEHMDQRTAPVI